jgi:ketosteroid isomerase-like protein
MTNRETVEAYFRHASAGEWDRWCDLFTDDVVMDEQLAGHIEGLATLRPMMAGFPKFYSRFTNTARQIVVDGDQVAVVSHISAANAAGEPIEADAAIYFKLRSGKIAYMANFHDSKPFEPFLKQLR